MIFPIIVLGLILRIISLDQSLWLDEAINVLATQKFSFLGVITEYAKADFHPPLFFIILWIWTKLFGIGEQIVRIPSVIFGVMTIYIVFLLGQKLYTKTLGLISALLLAINPLHIYYSQEARMYALATLAVVLNFLLLIKLLRNEKVNFFHLVTSNLLVLLSDYVAYLSFPSQLIFLLLSRQWRVLKFWLKSVGIAILLGIWWLPVFLSQFNVGSVASSNLPAWKFIVGGFDIKTTPLTLVKFIIGRISLSDKIIYYLILLPVCSLFVYLILRSITFIKSSFKSLLFSWLLVPIILATIISFVVPIYSYFRVLFALPSFIILIALGIQSFRSKLRYIFLGMVLFIQTFSSIVYLFNSNYQREDWGGLVNYLKSADKNALILFESSGTLPPFDYHAKNSLNARGALKDFPANGENDIIDSTSLQFSKDIFLVDYLVEITDPQRLVKKKLTEIDYQLSETKDFTGVGFVYHYVRN